MKVEIMMWRMLQNRISTTDNLFKRGVLKESQIRYINRCDVVENIAQIFFECPTSVGVWQRILSWLNYSTAMHNNTLSNLNQFAGLSGRG